MLTWASKRASLLTVDWKVETLDHWMVVMLVAATDSRKVGGKAAEMVEMKVELKAGWTAVTTVGASVGKKVVHLVEKLDSSARKKAE